MEPSRPCPVVRKFCSCRGTTDGRPFGSGIAAAGVDEGGREVFPDDGRVFHLREVVEQAAAEAHGGGEPAGMGVGEGGEYPTGGKGGQDGVEQAGLGGGEHVAPGQAADDAIGLGPVMSTEVFRELAGAVGVKLELGKSCSQLAHVGGVNLHRHELALRMESLQDQPREGAGPRPELHDHAAGFQAALVHDHAGEPGGAGPDGTHLQRFSEECAQKPELFPEQGLRRAGDGARGAPEAVAGDPGAPGGSGGSGSSGPGGGWLAHASRVKGGTVQPGAVRSGKSQLTAPVLAIPGLLVKRAVQKNQEGAPAAWADEPAPAQKV